MERVTADTAGAAKTPKPEKGHRPDLPQPDICRRDRCGFHHYHPLTHRPPDLHVERYRGQQVERFQKPIWRAVRFAPGVTRETALYSTREVATALSVSPRTVIRWILSGQLPAKRPGGTRGHFRVQGADLAAFVRKSDRPIPLRAVR